MNILKAPYFVFLGLFLLFPGCKQGDFFVSSRSIKGQVLYDNSDLGNTNPLFARNVTVKLKNQNTADDFIYSIASDGDGLFSFDFIPDKEELFLQATGASDGIEYDTTMKIDNATDWANVTLKLKPRYKYAALITFKNTTRNQPWHNVKTFLYRNEKMADSALAAEKAPESGYIDSKTTNEFGRVLYSNLEKGAKYYIILKDSVTGIVLSHKKEISINSNTMTQFEIDYVN